MGKYSLANPFNAEPTLAPKNRKNRKPDLLPVLALEPLSGRELEILRMIAQGASNREIADALFLAEGTVKNYVTNILGKLEVRDRTQAALKAKESDLI